MSSLEGWHRRLVLAGGSNWAERLLLMLLRPFGWVYGVVGQLRVAGYRCGLFPTYHATVPVISVGNLAVGGTGKTPVTDYLVKYFQQQGLKPAVVSRGYGGKGRAEVGIVCQGQGPLLTAAVCGDEPYLLARRNPEALILVARKRALGVCCAIDELGADVIILDDGFQHLAVARDLDLALLDARAPLGNGRPLPAGLLREFPAGLHRANLYLLTHADPGMDVHLPITPLWRCRHQLAPYAYSLEGERLALAELKGERLAAFAGIADPQSFFSALEAAGLTLSATLAPGDHAEYNDELLVHLQQAATEADFLLTTEKDAVKLTTAMFPIPCLQVPVAVTFEDESGFRQALHTLLRGTKMNIRTDLLEILACPKCKGPVAQQTESGGLRCERCRLEYPVRDDIPVMLIDEAESF